jgi:DNA polymerase III subunit gamma/tau
LKQQLSLSYRPSTFDEMVGAEKLVARIRGHFKNGRAPQAWLFTGDTGAGKTTVARILALSLQCTHQEKFGNPCAECRANTNKFDITEVPPEQTKADAIRSIVSACVYAPMPPSRKKIYILDELHKMQESSQDLLLKPMEDCPRSTVWICCTTVTDKILRTLRRRCIQYDIKPLELEQIRSVVKVAFKVAKGTKDSEALVEELLVANVSTPGLIMNAVEKYLATPECSPEEAVRVERASEVDIKALNRCIVKGDWKGAARWIANCTKQDAQSIRYQLAAYLREILVNDGEFSERNDVIAGAIKTLVQATQVGEDAQVALVAAVAYDLSRRFREHKV